MADPILKKKIRKNTAPAQEIDIEVEPGPDDVIVRSPATLAEALGDPVAVIPEEPEKKTRRVVKRTTTTTRRKRVA
jgi:hypothetical protein